MKRRSDYAEANFTCEACGKMVHRRPVDNITEFKRRRFCSRSCWYKCKPARDLRVRFYEKVEKRADDECWHWLAYRTPGEYGKFTQKGRNPQLAHRVAYELEFGEVPRELHVCHRCDNPPCVNPAHLFLGTDADNMADCAAKERTCLGERNRAAKLSETEVRQIRASFEPLTELSRRFGVTVGTLSVLKNGKTWRHVR